MALYAEAFHKVLVAERDAFIDIVYREASSRGPRGVHGVVVD
jgi:hypothetical protein